jgi:hypothetical protein
LRDHGDGRLPLLKIGAFDADFILPHLHPIMAQKQAEALQAPVPQRMPRISSSTS